MNIKFKIPYTMSTHIGGDVDTYFQKVGRQFPEFRFSVMLGNKCQYFSSEQDVGDKYQEIMRLCHSCLISYCDR